VLLELNKINKMKKKKLDAIKAYCGYVIYEDMEVCLWKM
jgi:hypothetical protein